jgi:Asparaginase, N-terminal
VTQCAQAGSQLPLLLPRSDARQVWSQAFLLHCSMHGPSHVAVAQCGNTVAYTVQNLVDSLTVTVDTPAHNRLSEVAICFGGKLLRGNRTQKASSEPALPLRETLLCRSACCYCSALPMQVHSSSYQAFASPSYPELAILGVDTEWR